MADRRVRKIRVIHTRVPEVLEEELKRLADSLKLPASKIVRAAIEDALDLADATEVELRLELGDANERLERWLRRRERRRRRWQRAYRKAQGLEPDDDDERDASRDDDADRNDDGERDDAAEREAPAPSDGDAAPAARAGDSGDHDSTPSVPEEIVGFQSMRLARANRCRLCARDMARGDEAFLGVGNASGPPFVVCPACAP